MCTNILIIGVDGLDSKLIKKWREDLPNISNLIKEGIYGHLKTSIPPMSSPAWDWFATGCQGGKMGVFDFIQPGFSYDAISSLNLRKKKTFWKILDEFGGSVGIINLPITYPIKKLKNGFIVPGFPVPLNPKKDVFTHPPELSEKIRDISGNEYIIDWADIIAHKSMNDNESYNMIANLMSIRTKVSVHLIKKYKPEFSIVAYTAIDRGSHKFFGTYRLKKLYMQQDKEIGLLLSELSEVYSDIIMVSDHGFEQVKGFFYLNQWLENEGYLVKKVFKSKLDNISSSLLEGLSDFIKKKLIDMLPQKIKKKLPKSYSYPLKIK